MVYLEYEDYKAKYLATQIKYDEILREKEELFQRTQPRAANLTDDKVSGGGSSLSAFDAYIIAKDKKKIDERLAEARGILEDRERLLAMKRIELRQSNAIEDKVYRMRYIDRIRVWRIARMVNYSEPQVYRILAEIRERLQLDRK